MDYEDRFSLSKQNINLPGSVMVISNTVAIRCLLTLKPGPKHRVFVQTNLILLLPTASPRQGQDLQARVL